MAVSNWPKTAVVWFEDNTSFVSVPFTWLLPQVYSQCVFLRQQGYKVRAGGPAVSLMPDYLASVAEIGGQVDALPHHNPNATFTSRGCSRRCSFCAVLKIEGDLIELDSWEPKPIVCDNNLLACSGSHFDKVIDSLKGLSGVDFNQGLDARLLTDYHIERLRELKLSCVHLAWDHTKTEPFVLSAISRLTRAGLNKRKIRVYVLIGYDDTPDDALYRLQTLKGWGIMPNPQRYNPLDTLKRDSYVAPGWTDDELRRFMRYWSRQVWLWNIPFEEYHKSMKRAQLARRS